MLPLIENLNKIQSKDFHTAKLNCISMINKKKSDGQ